MVNALQELEWICGCDMFTLIPGLVPEETGSITAGPTNEVPAGALSRTALLCYCIHHCVLVLYVATHEIITTKLVVTKMPSATL